MPECWIVFAGARVCTRFFIFRLLELAHFSAVFFMKKLSNHPIYNFINMLSKKEPSENSPESPRLAGDQARSGRSLRKRHARSWRRGHGTRGKSRAGRTVYACCADGQIVQGRDAKSGGGGTCLVKSSFVESIGDWGDCGLKQTNERKDGKKGGIILIYWYFCWYKCFMKNKNNKLSICYI